jgi:hypothetical protein
VRTYDRPDVGERTDDDRGKDHRCDPLHQRYAAASRRVAIPEPVSPRTLVWQSGVAEFRLLIRAAPACVTDFAAVQKPLGLIYRGRRLGPVNQSGRHFEVKVLEKSL